MTIKEATQFFELYSQWIGEGLRPVPKEQAQERANVCLKCPLNQPKRTGEFLKTEVALLVRRQIELKNQMNLRIDGEKSLHICTGCGCSLKLKPWVPIEMIRNTTDITKLNQSEPRCWILNESDRGNCHDN